MPARRSPRSQRTFSRPWANRRREAPSSGQREKKISFRAVSGGIRSVGVHVYSDPASERHANNMAQVEAPERFPAALAGVEEAERASVKVERCRCQPAPR